MNFKRSNNFFTNAGCGLSNFFNPIKRYHLVALSVAAFALYSHFTSDIPSSSNLTNSTQATEISTFIPHSYRDNSLQVNIYGDKNSISLVSLAQYHSGSGDNVLYQSSSRDSLDALLFLGGQE